MKKTIATLLALFMLLSLAAAAEETGAETTETTDTTEITETTEDTSDQQPWYGTTVDENGNNLLTIMLPASGRLWSYETSDSTLIDIVSMESTTEDEYAAVFAQTSENTGSAQLTFTNDADTDSYILFVNIAENGSLEISGAIALADNTISIELPEDPENNNSWSWVASEESMLEVIATASIADALEDLVEDDNLYTQEFTAAGTAGDAVLSFCCTDADGNIIETFEIGVNISEELEISITSVINE